MAERNIVLRPASLLACSIGLLASSAAFAQSEAKLSMDVSVSGGVDSNPYLEANGAKVASVSFNAAPMIVINSATGTTTIKGNVDASHYSERYGWDVGGGAGASIERRLSDKTSLNLGLGYKSSNNRNRDILRTEVTAPTDIPEPTLDPTEGGLRQRIETYDAYLGLSHLIDSASTISFSANGSLHNFKQGVGRDYLSAGGRLSYGRRLSDRATVSLSVAASKVDYRNAAGIATVDSDSFILSPNLGVSLRLGESFTFNAATGFSYVTTKLINGSNRKSYFFSGNVNLCNQGNFGSICVNASREARPTSIGLIGAITNVGASISPRLSSKDTLVFSGRYSRSNTRGQALPLAANARRAEAISASGNYSRRLGERLWLFIQPSYERRNDDVLGRHNNYAVSGGLRYRFGGTQ